MSDLKPLSNAKLWLLLAAAFGTFSVGAGFMHAYTVFLVTFIEVFGWSRAEVSLAYSVSQAIVRAGDARKDSRGAHFRIDYPDTSDLAASAFVRVRKRAGDLDAEMVPVAFTRVAPGESLLETLVDGANPSIVSDR